jgi:hypothetical protein
VRRKQLTSCINTHAASHHLHCLPAILSPSSIATAQPTPCTGDVIEGGAVTGASMKYLCGRLPEARIPEDGLASKARCHSLFQGPEGGRAIDDVCHAR